MSDERSYLERAQNMGEILNGRRSTPEELEQRFALYSPQRRAGILDSMDGEPQYDVDDSDAAMREAFERAQHRKNLGEIDRALRKVNR
jgi:hypothetical protein